MLPSAPAVALPATPPLRASVSVAQRTGRGALWVLLAFALTRALGFATNLVLARLLSPAEFGVVSFAMIPIGAFALLQDLGVTAAIVQSRRDLRIVGGTALTLNVAAALLLFVVLVAAAPTVAAMGGTGTIASVLSLLAFGLVIDALGSVQSAALMKELAFRRKFVPDVVPALASGLVSIAAALTGFGVWSLVFGYLTKTVVSSATLWIRSPVRPRPELNWPIARDLLAYGRHVAATSVLGFALMNVDYLIVGSRLGTADLGLYSMAFVVANLPATIVGQTVTRVAFPAYSRLRADAAPLADLFADITAIVCALTVPIGLATFVGAHGFVVAVLGAKWIGAVEPLRLLALYAVVRSLALSFAPVYKAVGRPEVEWKLVVLNIALLVPSVLVSLPYGIAGVAASQLVVAIICLPVTAVLAARHVGFTPARAWRLARGHAFIVLLTAVAVGAAYLWSRPVLDGPDPIVPIALAAATGAACLVGQVALNPRLFGIARSGLAPRAVLR